jgi:MFS family permease
MTRTWLVAFQQAVRSLTLILLPLAFISLITWATAGSSTGNTADPLRAAIWFFLVAHHIPLDLSLSNTALSGNLTFFPIGALLIPFLAIRSAYQRMLNVLEQHTLRDKRSYVLSLAFMYALVGSLISLFALGTTVQAQFYLVFPVLFLVAAVSGFLASNLLPEHALQFPWQRGLRIAWISTLAMIGFGALIFTLSLIWHFPTVLNLTRVIEPGFFGGLAFFAIQALYLPNFAVSALSYIAGSGVVIGDGSWLNPFVHRIDEIPAIPLLGGLPVNSYPPLIIGAAFVVFLGVVAAQYGVNTYLDKEEQKRYFFSSVSFVFVLNLIVGRAASGELLSDNLSSVGPHWWLLPIIVSIEFAVGILIWILIPKVKQAVKDARSGA